MKSAEVSQCAIVDGGVLCLRGISSTNTDFLNTSGMIHPNLGFEPEFASADFLQKALFPVGRTHLRTSVW